MKLKQIQISKLLQDQLDTATQRIVLVENICESKSKELSKLRQQQIETNDKLDRATKKIAFLQNENESKTKELSKVKYMEEKLALANTKIVNLEKLISEKDLELKSIKEILFSYTPLPLPLPTGEL
ncbi:hypothetical protein LOD99_11291 [Oopsacas minuta]|uniref:Uncharacterized protein n=1 Tax=Oopsacas minuta TaxID=111878 RepID=A0AAV7K4U6_9METZ|nr:hypothetical protein LOD99_11291 [Oopsacas minuta]